VKKKWNKGLKEEKLLGGGTESVWKKKSFEKKKRIRPAKSWGNRSHEIKAEEPHIEQHSRTKTLTRIAGQGGGGRK